jgi:hypothetical protein
MPVPPCRGSDLRLPFECPSDFIFHIPHMDDANITYRMPGFLAHPQVPEAVRRWQAEVQVLASKPKAATVVAAAGATAAAAAGTGPVSALWPGMGQAELEQALKPLEAAAVISIRCGV